MFDSVFDDSRRVLPITAAIGGTIVVFSTVLPWYSFDVVLPAGRVIHFFTVTATQWDSTTLAPILELAGALAALLIAGLVPRPAANVTVALIGLAIFVYGLVRCFVVPSLGVGLLPRWGTCGHTAGRRAVHRTARRGDPAAWSSRRPPHAPSRPGGRAAAVPGLAGRPLSTPGQGRVGRRAGHLSRGMVPYVNWAHAPSISSRPGRGR